MLLLMDQWVDVACVGGRGGSQMAIGPALAVHFAPVLRPSCIYSARYGLVFLRSFGASMSMCTILDVRRRECESLTSPRAPVRICLCYIPYLCTPTAIGRVSSILFVCVCPSCLTPPPQIQYPLESSTPLALLSNLPKSVPP